MSPELGEAPGLGQIAGESLDVAADELGHGLAAAAEGDVFHLGDVRDAGCLGGDQHLQVVPSADCRAAGEGNGRGIGLDLVEQLRKRLDRRILGDRDHAVV